MAFLQKLSSWYDDNGRQLPWRGIDDPYRIWLSEIILQQTRIEQGTEYYFRFIDRFPDIFALANATEEQVLRQWQGLGYYSRARNLHHTAQHVAFELDGQFPKTSNELLKLKGIGRYTAAAIASFAFLEPIPVIDGNVYRFISRLFGITSPIATNAAYNEFEKRLLKLIDRSHPDHFNAALMDFGSIQCTPRPDCTKCPFAEECNALRTGCVNILPIKAKKKQPKERHFVYLHITWNEEDTTKIIVHQRTDDDIWKGLWELPLIESEHPLEAEEMQSAIDQFARESLGVDHINFQPVKTLIHQLTHRTIKATFLRAELERTPPKTSPEFSAIEASKIKDIPVSRLIDKYLQSL